MDVGRICRQSMRISDINYDFSDTRGSLSDLITYNVLLENIDDALKLIGIVEYDAVPPGFICGPVAIYPLVSW